MALSRTVSPTQDRCMSMNADATYGWSLLALSAVTFAHASWGLRSGVARRGSWFSPLVYRKDDPRMFRLSIMPRIAMATVFLIVGIALLAHAYF
jgi:hypothetical protein